MFIQNIAEIFLFLNFLGQPKIFKNFFSPYIYIYIEREREKEREEETFKNVKNRFRISLKVRKQENLSYVLCILNEN